MIIQGLNKQLLKNLQDAFQNRENTYKLLNDALKTTLAPAAPITKNNSAKKPSVASVAAAVMANAPAIKVPSLGEAFKKITPFLKVYTTYITNYSVAAKTLKECRQQNQQLDSYFKKCKESKPECRGLDVTSFMILPIQRIPRYKKVAQRYNFFP